jgi:Rifampin ADP-ribosyl transferase
MTIKTNRSKGNLMASNKDLSTQRFYHGTKANLNPGDLIKPGFKSNYSKRKKAAYVYLTATLDAAVWGAELALGEGSGRIYMVKPTGPIEDDPNLTDKKYPGNPTKSYRSRNPLQVSCEITDWRGHSPEELITMKENLERLNRLGIEAIED